jgi:hypothetical protein
VSSPKFIPHDTDSSRHAWQLARFFSKAAQKSERRSPYPQAKASRCLPQNPSAPAADKRAAHLMPAGGFAALPLRCRPHSRRAPAGGKICKKEGCSASGVHQGGCERVAGTLESSHAGSKDFQTHEADRRLVAPKGTEARHQHRAPALGIKQTASAYQTTRFAFSDVLAMLDWHLRKLKSLLHCSELQY